MPSIRRIALLGARGSGKTWLGEQLAAAFAKAGETVQIEESAEFLAPAASELVSDVVDATRPLAGAPLKATLLLGLDLQAASPEQLRADQALRDALSQAGQPFQVIYGSGLQRLAHALHALQALQVAPLPSAPDERQTRRKPWVWTCEKCSDPVCEHRLLSDLLAER